MLRRDVAGRGPSALAGDQFAYPAARPASCRRRCSWRPLADAPDTLVRPPLAACSCDRDGMWLIAAHGEHADYVANPVARFASPAAPPWMRHTATAELQDLDPEIVASFNAHARGHEHAPNDERSKQTQVADVARWARASSWKPILCRHSAL
jgi:hypothetical protein